MKDFNVGMDAYIFKPIQAEELLEATGGVYSRMEHEKIKNHDAEVSQQAFDIEAVLARMNGNMQLLVELAEICLNECPQYMSNIHAAIASKDGEEIHRVAHQFKSVVGWFSSDAADLLGQLETECSEGNLDSTEQLGTALQDKVDRLSTALAKLCDTEISKTA